MYQMMEEGWVPPVEYHALEEWHHLVMANCGEQIERFDIVMNDVPFYRLASWAESRLKQAEEMEARLARS